MADTDVPKATLITQLADNSSGLITEQIMRNILESLDRPWIQFGLNDDGTGVDVSFASQYDTADFADNVSHNGVSGTPHKFSYDAVGAPGIATHTGDWGGMYVWEVWGAVSQTTPAASTYLSGVNYDPGSGFETFYPNQPVGSINVETGWIEFHVGGPARQAFHNSGISIVEKDKTQLWQVAIMALDNPTVDLHFDYALCRIYRMNSFPEDRGE